VCDQGAAVERWAAEHKPEMEGGAMDGKRKIKKTGKCENCQRENMVIKALGFCNNCYDTPKRKGYKPGSREWTDCQAKIRSRFDPLFRPVKAPPRKPAPEAEGPSQEAADLNAEEEETLKQPPEMTEARRHTTMPWDQVDARIFTRPEVSIAFSGLGDQAILSWLEGRANVNRRLLRDEILSIIEGVINAEEKARDDRKRFEDYVKKTEAMNQAELEKLYSIKTPEGNTIPAEELSRRDKQLLGGIVVALVAAIIGAIPYYCFAR
jgi:hypothetical protein